MAGGKYIAKQTSNHTTVLLFGNGKTNCLWQQSEDMSVNDGAKFLSDKIVSALDEVAPVRSRRISYKQVIRDPWMIVSLTKM